MEGALTTVSGKVIQSLTTLKLKEFPRTSVGANKGHSIKKKSWEEADMETE